MPLFSRRIKNVRRRRAVSRAVAGEALECRWLLSVSASPIRAGLAGVDPPLDHISGIVTGNPTIGAPEPAFTPVAVPTLSEPVPKGSGLQPAVAPQSLSSLTLVSNLSNPHGLAADEIGNIWLSANGASTPSNVLYEYSSAGTLLNSYTVDSSSSAQPGPVAIVYGNSTTNALTENMVLWEKSSNGAVYAFNPATASQTLLFTATALSVDLSSVYDILIDQSENYSAIINMATAVYSGGLAIDETPTYDNFFLTGMVDDYSFVLRVREENNSIISAKMIASGSPGAGGVAVEDGEVMAALGYGGNAMVPFFFEDTFPETSSYEAVYDTISVNSDAIATEPYGNYIFANASSASGGSVVYTEVNTFSSTVSQTSYTASLPDAALSYGITYDIATNSVLQSFIFNSVSSGYGEIWNEPLATVFAGYTPAQLQSYYGLSQLEFDNGTTPDGTGQMIAIIDFNDDPNLKAELTTFDTAMGIPAPPSLTQLNQTGGTTLPSASDETAEESLDVEWAHAMAPGANIIVFETSADSDSDIDTAITTAASYPGVSVVSMSFGGNEATDRFADSLFVTPAGHIGVTFVASSGDGGAYPDGDIADGVGVNSPASSSNVLAVGGTTLAYNAATGTPVNETAWGYPDPDDSNYFVGSGGGVSKYESEPSWQTPVAGTLSGRGVPDVSFLADPNTGVKQYDMQGGGWLVDGGTSLSAPCWAGFIAIINQGRVMHGLPTLNGSTDPTDAAIYALGSSDFNDITTGTNGKYNASTGYDLVTGRGTPILNRLIPDMVDADVTFSAVTLPSGSEYIRRDADGVDYDVYNNSTGTGTPAEFYLRAGVSSFALTGSSGGQALTLDWSNGTPLPQSGLTFTGQGSGNTLTVIGTNSSNDTVVTSTSQFSLSSVPVNFSDVATVNFVEGAGNDQLSVNSGTLILKGETRTDSFSNVVIGQGALLQVAAPATTSARILLEMLTLSLAGTRGAWTSTLDLNKNDMAVINAAGQLSTIFNQIASGYNGGQWNGNGIIDSAAGSDTTHLTSLGVILNSDNGSTLYGTGTTLGPFDGASPGGPAVLIKSSYAGDANLDGKVDGSDYARIDNGYLNHLTGWYNGDFNYDGVINGSDYTLIDNAFNTQGASLTASLASPQAMTTCDATIFNRLHKSSYAPTVFSSGTPIVFSNLPEDNIEVGMAKKDVIDELMLARQ